MTGLADAILAGKIALSSNSLIQYFCPVGAELDASRVVHIAAYEPDVGGGAITRINMAGMTVCALDVLPLAVVCQFTGMTVCADVDRIGCAASQVGAQQ